MCTKMDSKATFFLLLVIHQQWHYTVQTYVVVNGYLPNL